MAEDIILRSYEASHGGFRSIKSIEGILQPVKRVPAPATWEKRGDKDNNDQVQIELEDAVIVEMEEGETEPDLQESKFKTWMGYAPPQQLKPSNASFFVRGFMKSGEKLAATRKGLTEEQLAAMPKEQRPTVAELYGTRVRLTRKEVKLFDQKKPDGTKEAKTATNFVIEEASSGGGNIDDLARTLVLGKTIPAAKRELTLNPRTKRDNKYREALEAGTLAEMLGIQLAGGVFKVK